MLGFGGGSSVLVGRNGRMFYLGEDMVRQSAGLVVRDQRVPDAVDLVAEIDAALKRKGVRFLVAVPPNSFDHLSGRVAGLGAERRTRHRIRPVSARELRARGIQTVDLRPAVSAARAGGDVFYRHDTHWTFRGAIAAFNAVAEADGHPDWRIDTGRRARAPGCAQGRRSRAHARARGRSDGARSNARPASGRNGAQSYRRSDAGRRDRHRPARADRADHRRFLYRELLSAVAG